MEASTSSSGRHWTQQQKDKLLHLSYHFSLFITVSLLFKWRFVAWRRGFPWKLASCCLCPNQLAFFCIFYVLGSYFRTLAVILVSDFCTFWSLLYCCTGVHRLSAGEVRHQTRPSERHVSDLTTGCRCLWPSVHRVVTHQYQWPPLRGQLHVRRLVRQRRQVGASVSWITLMADRSAGNHDCVDRCKALRISRERRMLPWLK